MSQTPMLLPIRSLVLLAVLFNVSCLGAQRPNILFLIADDLGWSDVGWHGSEINTPHLDALARAGVILDQHYVTPMCSSTRACLLSGRYSTRFGLDSATNNRVFPPGMTTLASGLRALGYETCLTGKWHLGSKPEWGPRQFGFVKSYGSFAGGVDQYSHFYKRGPYQKTWHRNDRYLREEGHATDLIAREAVRWIENTKKGHPWFIQVAFTAVHVPIQEPEEWVLPYAGKIANESRRRYAACATHMDHVIGGMVAALERTAQKENTLIIFTSDNGGSGPWAPSGKYPGTYQPSPVLGNNQPLRGGKGTVYEGGVRVPAFIHWPARLSGGTTFRHPLHIVDWMPTLLALAGYSSPTTLPLDGRDAWPLLVGKERSPAPRTLYFKRGQSFALRHGDWKLVTTGPSKVELFDLARDPHEKFNLAPANPGQVARLRDLLNRERKKEKGAALGKPVGTPQ